MSAISKSCGAAAALVAGVCVAAPSGGPNAVFLCKVGDTSQVEPTAFSQAAGLAAVASGQYVLPDAVLGGTGKTKLGDYTLTCQETGLVLTKDVIDESGQVFGPDAVTAYINGQGNRLDLYPVAV